MREVRLLQLHADETVCMQLRSTVRQIDCSDENLTLSVLQSLTKPARFEQEQD